VVSRLLAEYNLDPRAIKGTGRDGRITREDVLGHVAGRGASARSHEPAQYVVGGDETVPLNSVRKRTADHMTKSWSTVPHVLQVVEADFSAVDRARRAAGFTYLPFIAWAVTRALVKYPWLNASFGGDRLVVHKRVNLGIAVDLNHEGLLVPVVKDAASRSLRDLARAMSDLADRARGNRLKPDDMTEGTYTISNNGAYGTLITAPIISPPQVAILSTDAVRKRAVVVESPQGDTVAVRPVGMLVQTFDHRAVDGAYAASFLNEVKAILEKTDWEKELNR
jgi:2-oxoglutarate dehydrogenase E2 component (dihydrolipoamide succinyltransferase)